MTIIDLTEKLFYNFNLAFDQLYDGYNIFSKFKNFENQDFEKNGPENVCFF